MHEGGGGVEKKDPFKKNKPVNFVSEVLQFKLLATNRDKLSEDVSTDKQDTKLTSQFPVKISEH
jgi:hypothetical protein